MARDTNTECHATSKSYFDFDRSYGRVLTVA